MSTALLIIEDDQALSQMLAMHFEDEGFQVEQAASCAEGLRRAQSGPVDLVLLDQQLPDGRGIDLLAPLLSAAPDLGVVMMTGQHDLELAIEAIGRGAADFVHKPIAPAALQATIDRLLEARRPAGSAGLPMAAPATPPSDLIGRSQAMLEVSKAIALSARGRATVLISGESGTGKEVVARLVHQHSGVAGPFIAVNCAAIVDTLLESELFGHERGAFTGAQARRAGQFEQAAGGTLFLDEIGELAPALQAKLLRVLQERVFQRVGGSDQLQTDARVIAATNRDLMDEVARGRFREDLAYRLRVLEIHLPPLRERPEDIPMLADGLLRRISREQALPHPVLADQALDRIMAYHWPGNVRELENRLTQALVRARGGVITPGLLALSESAGSREDDEAAEEQVLRTLDAVEAEHIQRVLNHTNGHKGRSSTILGISRPALDRKISKHGLRVPGRDRP